MFYILSLSNITSSWQIRSLTFVLFKVKSILLVSNNLLHVDDAAVFELPQDLDLSDGRDGESLLLVVQAHFLQSHKFSCQTKTEFMGRVQKTIHYL